MGHSSAGDGPRSTQRCSLLLVTYSLGRKGQGCGEELQWARCAGGGWGSSFWAPPVLPVANRVARVLEIHTCVLLLHLWKHSAHRSGHSGHPIQSTQRLSAHLTVQDVHGRSRASTSTSHAGNGAQRGGVLVHICWATGPTSLPFCPHSREDGPHPVPRPRVRETKTRGELLKHVFHKPTLVLGGREAETVTNMRADMKL